MKILLFSNIFTFLLSILSFLYTGFIAFQDIQDPNRRSSNPREEALNHSFLSESSWLSINRSHLRERRCRQRRRRRRRRWKLSNCFRCTSAVIDEAHKLAKITVRRNLRRQLPRSVFVTEWIRISAVLFFISHYKHHKWEHITRRARC